MMSKKFRAGFAVLLLTATAWADDPWKDKSFKEWSEKEVRKILEDSPWARPVKMPAKWRSGDSARTDLPRDAGGQGSRSAGGASGDQAVASAGSDASAQGPTPLATFFVRWVSARTLREAMARSAVLQGRARDEDADRFLTQEVPDYQVAVVGADMAPFARVEENDLKQKSHLRLKKSKQKLAPGRVEIQRAADGKRVTAVVFHFSKTTANGEPAIPLDEKEIEFSCEAGGNFFKASFDLQKMAGKQGLEL